MYDSLTGAVVPSGPARPAPAGTLAPAGLGKRQGNLLTAVLRGIPLMGRTSQVPFAEADVRKVLARFQPTDDGQAAGLVNRLRPGLLNAVVGPAARVQGYIRGLPERGVEPLLDAVGKAVSSPMVLRVVFGASIRMPLRALSYVLPAVSMARRVHDVTGRWPYVQATYLGHLGARINSLPAQSVAEEGRLLAECLGRLLAAVSAKGLYGVFTDRELPRADEQLRTTLDRLGPSGRQDVLERLRGKGGSLSDRQTLEYAAAHVLMHDHGAIPLTRLRGAPAPSAPVVVDIGGLQERHFYGVRSVFADLAGREPLGPLVLTRHSVPPYTMSREGDLALRDFLDGTNGLRTLDDLRRTVQDPAALPTAVRRDLQLLCSEDWLDALDGLRR